MVVTACTSGLWNVVGTVACGCPINGSFADNTVPWSTTMTLDVDDALDMEVALSVRPWNCPWKVVYSMAAVIGGC